MKIFKLFLLLSLVLPAQAQWKWTNPTNAGYPVVQGQGFSNEIGNTYTRLPERAKDKIRKDVWNLSQQSAGLSIHFYSDAPQLKIRYTVSGGHAMPHMPATGVSGLDLYSINSDGKWQREMTSQYSFADTIQYTYSLQTTDPYHKRGYEYRLYLPLYNGVKWMEIGTPDNYTIEYMPLRKEKPIVVYGTSIAQGACASRPGMAWTNVLARALDQPLINLGFSGNGRLEKEVLDFINEIDARLYILDCIPNLTGATDDDLIKIITNAVHQLRASHKAPILLVEHTSGCNTFGGKEATARNEASRKAFNALIAAGQKELYYLPCSEINLSEDALVDYVHPSDLGMQQESDAYEKIVRRILKEHKGMLSTTQPVTQRREPDNYEWQKRHREILELNQSNPPQAVIIGNSITHFWGGEPLGPRLYGKESWEKEMRPAGFRNLGYGYDRIENVLWRVYHGELDGYNAKKIVLKIGTNNVYMNTEEEIVEGLRFLLAAIRERQPQAEIKVIAILPRRDGEEKVANLNKKIEEMVKKEGYKFTDAGASLLLKSGKLDESFFHDGLHPNEKGYKKIAKLIAE